MDSLTADELRSRLTFDYQTVMLMSCPMMMVEPYRNLDDLLARRNMIHVAGPRAPRCSLSSQIQAQHLGRPRTLLQRDNGPIRSLC